MTAAPAPISVYRDCTLRPCTWERRTWTQGQYDLVVLGEADNEAAVSAFGLAVSSAGNVRFQTLRAFSKDEMSGILAKLP